MSQVSTLAARMPTNVEMPTRGVLVVGLEHLRKRRALTQLELAQAAGVDRKTVVRAENGRAVDVSIVRKLAAALGVEPAVLLNGDR